MKAHSLLLVATAAAFACSQTPAPVPSATQTGTVSSADGVSIAFETRGSGTPAIVFVHCWCCDRSFFDQQMSALESQHMVVGLDLAGHGQSGAAREAWSIEAFAADVEAVVTQLALDQFVLVGHSMGGPVALAAARRMPERVRGIVAIDTLHNVERVRKPEERDGWKAMFATDFEASMRDAVKSYLFRPDSDPEVVSWVTERAVRCDPTVALGAVDGMHEFDEAAAAAAVQAPVRAINTDLNSTEVDANKRHFRDYGLLIMEGLGHYPHLEASAAFNGHLERVIGQL
jgi:pimeloyl-ACP methyl ester carboxylesterase